MDKTFFSDLEEISSRNDLQLTIKTKDGIMSVLVMPKAITLSGTPAELDAGFLDAIRKPFAKTEGLSVSTSLKPDTAPKTTAKAEPAKQTKAPEPKPAAAKRPDVKKAPAEPDGLFAPVDDEEEELAAESGEEIENEA